MVLVCEVPVDAHSDHGDGARVAGDALRGQSCLFQWPVSVAGALPSSTPRVHGPGQWSPCRRPEQGRSGAHSRAGTGTCPRAGPTGRAGSGVFGDGPGVLCSHSLRRAFGTRLLRQAV
ncbi:energy homeostasis associated [Columba livia]|uniref:Energy homeostasis associated n=1 Tax=Columba livia TaxID=8932 RepID=A0A2I0LGG6_COLLI|nr:energy homeostasis associated [Columba livia]